MISTVIFDADGLLTDTERLHCQAYQQTMSEIGVVMTEEDYADHWIRAGRTIADFVRQRGLNHDPIELRQRKNETYIKLLQTSLRPMPGAVELLRTLRGRKRLAVASSGFRHTVRYALQQIDVERFFEVIVTSEDVLRIKPHPDLFLYAAEQLDVPPSECVVLEDAEKGILAAHAAGMKSIAVPTPHTQNNDFSKATRVVRSLEEVTLELLDAL